MDSSYPQAQTQQMNPVGRGWSGSGAGLGSAKLPEAVPTRSAVESPIGQALAALEESCRDLHYAIDRHGDRLHPVMHPAPPPATGADKQAEPISVLERVCAANSYVRIAQGRLDSLTERLLV